MKRNLLLLFAILFTAIAGYGQDVNLSAGEGVTAKIGDTDFSNVLKDAGAQPNSYDTNGEMNIVVDLGASKTINGFSITFRGDRWVSEFTLSYSTDGSSYTKIDDYETGRTAQEPETTIAQEFASAVTAQYIKYTSKKEKKNNTEDTYSETIKNFQLFQYVSEGLPPTHNDMYEEIFSKGYQTPAWQLAWNGAAIDGGVAYYGGTPVKSLKTVGAVHFGKTGDQQDFTGNAALYENLSVDIYVASATNNYQFNFDNGGYTQDIELAAGWNTKTVAITGDAKTHLKILSIRCKDDSKTDLKLANIYFSKATIETAEIGSVNLDNTSITTVGSCTVSVKDKAETPADIVLANLTLTVKKKNGNDYTETTDAVVTNGKFTALKAGTYRIEAAPKDGISEITGSANSEDITVTAAQIGTLTVTPTSVPKDVATELTFKVTLQGDDNVVLDNNYLSFKVGGSAYNTNYTGTSVGTVTVTVESADGDVYAGSAETTIKVVNPLPTATLPNDPTDVNDDVNAIISHYYYVDGTKKSEKSDRGEAWGGGPNPLWTSIEEVEVGDSKVVYKVTGTGIADRPASNGDWYSGVSVPAVADCQYINVSVFPNTATQLKIYQDNGYANALTATVTPREWNYITLPCSFTANYFCMELVEESEFYMDNFYLSKLPADVTGISKVELSEENAVTNVDLPLTVTVKGIKNNAEVTIGNTDLDFTVTPATGTLTATTDSYTFKATEKGVYTIEVAPKATVTDVKGTATATITVSDMVTLGSLTVDPTSVVSMTETELAFTVKDTDGGDVNNSLVDISLVETDQAKGTLTTDNKFTASIVQGVVKFVVTPKEGVTSVQAGTAAITAELTVTKQDLTISDPDANDIVKVTGSVASAEDLAKITTIDALAIDLSGAAFDTSIKKITPKYANAMLIVAGEIGDANVATSTVAAQLSETKNLIVKRGDGYYFPIKQLEITDGEPVWTGFFVSGNTAGWKYTRTIAAKAMETALLPAAATLPEGLTAYTISSNSAETMTLTKGGAAAQVPLLLYNSTDAAITLTVEGNGDFDVRTKETHTLEVETGTTFVGSYETKALTDAKTLIMKDGEPVLQDLTEVKPFRAYLTLTTIPQEVIAQGINEPQEIKTVTIGLDPKQVEIGTATDLKLIVIDTAGKTIDNTKLLFTANPADIGTFGTDGEFTATKAGDFTVKVAPRSTEKRVNGSAESEEKVTAVENIPVLTLKTLTIGATKIVVGKATDLQLTVEDGSEEPQVIDNTKLTFIVTPADAGVFGKDGKFTAAKAGEFTITAKPNENEAYLAGEASAKATAEEPVQMVVPDIPTPAADSMFAPIYIYNGQETVNKTAGWITDYNGKAEMGEEINKDGRVAMPFYNTKCVFFYNSTIGDWAADINPSENEYGKLHLDIYSKEAAEGMIAFEQTTTIGNEHPFTLKADAWTGVDIDLEGETKLHTMSVRMDSVDIALANIYFTKAAPNPDSLKVATLVIGSPFVALGKATDLKLVAKNNKGVTIEARHVTYSVKDATQGSFDDDGLFTAKITGNIVIVAKTTVEGRDYTAEGVVTVLTAPEAPKDGEVFAGLYPAQEGTATAFVGDWENKSQPQAEVDLDGQKVKPIASLGTVFINNADVTSLVNQSFNPMEKKYGKIHVELYSVVAAKGMLSLKDAADVAFALPAGKWTAIEYDLDSANVSKVGNITIGMEKVGETYPDVVLANMYFTKAAENPDNNIVADIAITKTLIAKNKAVDLGIVVRNNKSVVLADSLYTLTADKGAFDDKGLFTTAADGPITITATSTVNKEKTAKATINTLPSPAKAPADDKANVLVVYSDRYGVTAYTPSETGWNNMYGSQEELELADGDKAIYVKEAGTFGLKLADVDLTDYYKVCAAIYSMEDYEGEVMIEGANMELSMTLKAGQWNYLELPLSGTRTKASWINFTAGPKASTNTILIDNVYFAKLANDEMIISKPNVQDVSVVVGHVTKDNVSELEELDAMAIDLSAADVAADISDIKLKNPNTMIIVSGKMDGSEVKESAMAKQLKGVQNVLVKREDGYYFPAKTLKIKDGEPVWSGFLISGNSKGWTYSRTFAPGEVTTACLPANLNGALPSGLKVYKYDKRDASGLHFSAAELGERLPRVVYNQSNKAVTITLNSKSDLDLRPTAAELDATGLVFVGTLSGVTKMEGYNLYTVNNLTDSQGTGTRASNSRTVTMKSLDHELPFRAYFLTDSAIDSNIKVDIKTSSPSKPTGIDGVDNDEDVSAVYNMNGIRIDDVDNLRPGIYIRNGKKFVVK